MTSKLMSIFYPGKSDNTKQEGSAAIDPSSSGWNQQQEISDSQPSAPSPQGVRFASDVQEIEPVHSVPQTTATSTQEARGLTPEAEEEIRTLGTKPQRCRLQECRMSSFAFEPMSLPPSRATSRESSPQTSARNSLTTTDRPSPAGPSVHSPPLSPQDSSLKETSSDAATKDEQDANACTITPQTAPPPQPRQDRTISGSTYTSTSPSGPSSTDNPSTAPTSVSEESLPSAQKRRSRFKMGPSESPSPSDQSPARTPRSQSPHHQRATTPPDDQSTKISAQKPLDPIEQRHHSSKEVKRNTITPAQALQNAHLLPKSGSGANETKSKRSSIFGGKKDGLGHVHDDASGGMGEKKHPGSMSELKRFFRLGHKNKRGESSATTSGKSDASAATKSLHHPVTQNNVPFADDHGLEAKYGKFGKVLGSGAGGSVRLLKRSSDGVTFAVKQFRERHSWESEKDYSKKVTAEFCIGSTLHHGNIIETMDIVQEKDRWYEVMEYAPCDLFAAVMTSKMSREEVACSFLQIVNGVNYLHGMGLAHRDLKLDNVVVNEHGIMKLIDFGSATVFRYPFENDLVLASGIVGSDPYLAPEVYDEKKYDPTATDVWSLAIIFCCMTLRRFPWKQPRVVDNSYRLFVSSPAPGTPTSEPESRQASGHDHHHHHHHHHHRHHNQRSKDRLAQSDGRDSKTSSEHSLPRDGDQSNTSVHHESRQSQVDGEHAAGASGEHSNKNEVVKGPWRLLRILPRESRHIISKMLKVHPHERATMDEIMQDPWLMDIPVCRQEEQGEVIRAPGHEHTLEAGSAPQTSSDR